jgi:Protein of unknown function (DUF3570)
VEVVVVAIKSDLLNAAAMRVPALVFFVGMSAATVQAADSINYQTYKYVEDGNRMEVFAGDLSIEKDFGTDYALSVDVGHDAISGATPCWKLKEGYANEYKTGLCNVADEVRNSVGLGWTVRDKQRNEFRFGVSTSHEPDFVSNEISAQGQWWHNEAHNRSYTVGIAMQDNKAVATANTNNTTDKPSNVYNIEVGVNQVLSRFSTVEVSLFASRDEGYLSNHYLKIVRSSEFGAHYLADDDRPEEREAAGISARWIKAWSNSVTSNLWLRSYADDWGVDGRTLEGKVYWDVNQHWRLNPVVRLSWQGAADFYRSYNGTPNTFAATGYGSNDERLGNFRATTVQLNTEYHAGEKWTFNGGVVHYKQSTGLSANWLTLGFSLNIT